MLMKFIPPPTLSLHSKISVRAAVLGVLAFPLLLSATVVAQKQEVVWSAQEKLIYDQIRTLRKLPDDVRARTTRDLALQIRQLPPTPNKLRLASGLAGLSTEGDFGHDTLQEVATTLADTLGQQPVPDKDGQPAPPYLELAQLVRYEHVQTALDAHNSKPRWPSSKPMTCFARTPTSPSQTCGERPGR
jgi:hypothetical protein